MLFVIGALVVLALVGIILGLTTIQGSDSYNHTVEAFSCENNKACEGINKEVQVHVVKNYPNSNEAKGILQLAREY